MKMEAVVLLMVVLSVSALAIILRWLRFHRNETRLQLPPGPKAWPLVGNLLQLEGGSSAHESFARLARVHGPVMALRLGAMTTTVISSAAAAHQMFKEHDAALAGRMLYESMNLGFGNAGSIITAQPGARWHMLRRLCATGLLTSARLETLQSIRKSCFDSLVRHVEKVEKGSAQPIDIGRLFFVMGMNHVGHLMLSRDIVTYELADAKENDGFFYHTRRTMELAGKPNIADFIPMLKRFDPQGIKRKMKFHTGRVLQMASDLVRERMEIRRRDNADHDQEIRNDFLDFLLESLEKDGHDVEDSGRLCVSTINAFITEMFFAATDTSAGTMEWAMAELICNPRAMKKAQDEVREAISSGSWKLEERSLASLPYLNAVIKETLRLHPPLPFLVPHKAIKPCTILGYHIAEGTQILVNVWGIGRDKDSWDDSEVFRPERFLEDASNVDFKGHHFGFIPFGAGKRMCPAIPLVARMIPLVLGVLLHSFDWALAGGLDADNMDMREQLGATLRKAAPLIVLAKPYSVIPHHEPT